MKLLGILAGGVRGAENGSVDIFVRGTATRAQVFADYDGSGAQTPTAALPLDAFGGLVAYCNQPVLCQVRSSAGDIVRQFTELDTATDVEVVSQSFTGQNYSTGVSGANLPTLLSTVLDLWKSSAGAIDFNVLVGSASRSLSAAMTAAGGLFFNVKDPAYGAVGNGIVDDRAAAQAAIIAAQAAGGIVIFPPGTYLLGSSGLTVSSGNGAVALLGYGATLTATAAPLTLLGLSGANPIAIIGLRLSTTGSGTSCITSTATGPVLILDSTITGTSVSPGFGSVLSMTGVGLVVALHSTFACTQAPAVNGPIRIGAGVSLLIGCTFTFSGTNSNFASVIYGGTGPHVLLGNTFAPAYLSGGTATNVILTNGVPSQTVLVGNHFLANTGGGGLGGSHVQAADLVYEFGNRFEGTAGVDISSSINYTAAFSDAQRYGPVALSRLGRKFSDATDGAAITLNVTEFGLLHVTRTTAAAQTITLSIAFSLPGWMVTLVIRNTSGGAPVETIAGLKGLASVTPGAGTNQTIVAQVVDVNGTLSLVLVSSTNWT